MSGGTGGLAATAPKLVPYGAAPESAIPAWMAPSVPRTASTTSTWDALRRPYCTVTVRWRLLNPVLASQTFALASWMAYSGRVFSAVAGSGRLSSSA
ncbi:hypothetical protein SAMN05443639_10915 [Stigmatella erecta]|uniref:Uncharacterized protein n=1 Tax=Stigmatella erecta TaxID=83460 RepID=A0A1I0K2S8_9BACT|nr:hypothetical protein SAMN05443639_10915 [Stigmatella erecta]